MHIYIYIYPVISWNRMCEWGNFLGVKYMSLSYLLPKVLKELRWWGSANGCPWGAIGLTLFLCCGVCWICGFCFSAIVFSPQCWRFLAYIAQLVAFNLQPAAAPLHSEVQRRLAEYHRGQ